MVVKTKKDGVGAVGGFARSIWRRTLSNTSITQEGEGAVTPLEKGRRVRRGGKKSAKNTENRDDYTTEDEIERKRGYVSPGSTMGGSTTKGSTTASPPEGNEGDIPALEGREVQRSGSVQQEQEDKRIGPEQSSGVDSSFTGGPGDDSSYTDSRYTDGESAYTNGDTTYTSYTGGDTSYTERDYEDDDDDDESSYGNSSYSRGESTLGESTAESSHRRKPAARTKKAKGKQDGKAKKSEGGFAKRASEMLKKASFDTRNTEASSRNKKKPSGPINESYLRSKHEIACLYLRSSKLEKAQRQFEEILSLMLDEYGPEHSRVATALHNLGIVQHRGDKLNDALDSLEDAVEVRQDTLGERHPKVADSLVELGTILLSMKEFHESLETLYEALEMREEMTLTLSGPGQKKNKLQIAKILNNIGCVYFEYRQLDNAEHSFQETLDMQKEIIGDDKPVPDPRFFSLLSAMCNLGYVYVERREWDEAISVLDEALKTQFEILERNNKLIQSTMDNLAYANLKNGNVDAALKIYQELLALQEETMGDNDITCAATMKKIVHLHSELFQYDKALEALLELEALQRQYLEDQVDRSRRHKRGGHSSSNTASDSNNSESVESDSSSKVTHEDLRRTREYIGIAQYQVLKFPAPMEVMNRTFGKSMRNPFTQQVLNCTCGARSEMAEFEAVEAFAIKPPLNICKMSGHKVSYA